MNIPTEPGNPRVRGAGSFGTQTVAPGGRVRTSRSTSARWLATRLRMASKLPMEGRNRMADVTDQNTQAASNRLVVRDVNNSRRFASAKTRQRRTASKV